MKKSMMVQRGAKIVGAEKVRGGWAYYDDAMRAWYLVSSDSLAWAAEMEQDGEWDYSQWCAGTTARELRSKPSWI